MEIQTFWIMTPGRMVSR